MIWSCQFAGSSGEFVAGDEDTVPRFITMLSMLTTSASSVLDRIEESTSERIPFSVEFFPARTDEALEKLWAPPPTPTWDTPPAHGYADAPLHKRPASARILRYLQLSI